MNLGLCIKIHAPDVSAWSMQFHSRSDWGCSSKQDVFCVLNISELRTFQFVIQDYSERPFEVLSNPAGIGDKHKIEVT